MEETRENLETIRVECRKFSSFVKRAWRILEPETPLVWNWHLDAICDTLEAISRGKINPRLIINISPGSSKSMIVSVLWQAWVWGPLGQKGKRFLSTSFEMANVTRDTRKTRDLILSEWYQALWPEVNLTRTGETSFENSGRGTRLGVAFSSLMGKRGDCLLGHSVIETDQGPRRIDDIAHSPSACNVISYDEHSRRVVLRPVQAVARRQAEHFYRVHFASGRVVDCTGDHRIYTARGYVEARFLSAGDVGLRLVRKGNDQVGGGDAQRSLPPRSDVRTRLRHAYDQRAERKGTEVPFLLSSDAKGQSLLLAPMQGNSENHRLGAAASENCGEGMRDMQYHLSAEVEHTAGSFLFAGVQGSRPCGGDSRGKQSGMARRGGWSPIQPICDQTLSENAAEDYRAGWFGVRRLPIDRTAYRPSHRQELSAERMGQLGDAVPVMSWPTAWSGTLETAEDAISLVERVCQPAVVYDIQVEGTRCFFANEILVHNCVVIDDPHSLDGAESETDRTKAVRRFIEGGRSRVNDRLKSAIVIVMQRVHMDDLTGAILAKKLGYLHLMIPMEFEPDRKCVIRIGPEPQEGANDNRPIFWQDPRTEPGELMDPVRVPQSEVDSEKDSEYSWNGQYQQRPAPREGGLFKVDKISIIEYSPGGGRACRGWDLAGTKRKTSAYTVGLLLRRLDDGRLIIEDVKRERKDPFGVKQMALDTATDDGMRIIQSFPQDPGQAGVAQKQDWAVLLEGKNFRFSPETGDKETRALGIASAISGDLVSMVRAPWNSALIEELRNFPAATFKDQVDALSRAYSELVVKKGDGAGGMPETITVNPNAGPERPTGSDAVHPDLAWLHG